MRRTVLASVLLAMTGAFVAPALASSAPPVPVGVGRDAKGGVCLYAFSWVPQCVDPTIVGAHPQTGPRVPVYAWQRADGSVCVAWGTTMPVCTPGVPGILPGAAPKQTLPVTVVNTPYAVGVLVRNSQGQPIAGAVVAKDGSQACIGISYQVPFCLN